MDSLKGLKLSQAVESEQEQAALREVFALKDATLIPEVTWLSASMDIPLLEMVQ